jgi:hypothetical protein
MRKTALYSVAHEKRQMRTAEPVERVLRGSFPGNVRNSSYSGNESPPTIKDFTP